jgi:hypothetical protein
MRLLTIFTCYILYLQLFGTTPALQLRRCTQPAELEAAPVTELLPGVPINSSTPSTLEEAHKKQPIK